MLQLITKEANCEPDEICDFELQLCDTQPSVIAVAKMASHAIFQYNILVIDDTHNTWTNICVKMIIIRLIGPRDEKIQNPEEIRSKVPRQR